MVRLSLLLFGLALGGILRAEVPAAGNAEIVALARAKAGDPAILARIESQPCRYQLTTADMAALRKSGVSGPVIAAMIRKCGNAPPEQAERASGMTAIPERPGLYLVERQAERVRFSLIVPAVITAGRAGGNGSLLLPATMRLTLPGKSAALVAAGDASFWIVEAQHAGRGGVQAGPAGHEGIRLVRLDQKSDRRQLRVGAATNALVLSGIDQDRVVPLSRERQPGGGDTFTPARRLEPGEYALVVTDLGDAFRLYDFTVR